MPPQSASSELEKADYVRRRRHALEMRLQKKSYAAISEELNVPVSTIRVWVREETIHMLPQEEREELRAHEVANIDADEDRCNATLRVLAKQGERFADERQDVTAILAEMRYWMELKVRLRKTRAMLTGINSDIRVQHNMTIRTEFDAEIEALAAELAGGGNLMSSPEQVLEDN